MSKLPLVFVMASAAACGGRGPQPTRPPSVSRLGDFLATVGDAKAIEAQLEDPIVLGGLWFPTQECRGKFQQPGPVGGDEISQLARCLATLPLKDGARDSASLGVRLVELEPGIELEITFERDRDEDIRSIGFVSRVLDADNAPTITQRAFESRLAQRALTAMGPALVWAKVCIDHEGVVASVRPDLVTDPAVAATVIEQVKQWRVEPFLLAGVPTYVCSMLRLTTEQVRGNEFVPRVALPGQGDAITVDEPALGARIAGDAKVVPSAEDAATLEKAGRPELVGVARFCVGADGKIGDAWLAASSGLPSWDAQMLAAVKQWQYPPRAAPACAFVEVIYRKI